MVPVEHTGATIIIFSAFTAKGLPILEVGFNLNLEQFTNLQKTARRHIVFSLTELCPFECRHCLVGSNDKTKKKLTMPLATVKRYVQDFVILAKMNVDRISITGGEPLLCPDHIKLLSYGALEQGMFCTVVTGCYWAVSDEAARRTVSEFSAVSCWHLSVDVFHEEFLPREYVAMAAEAVLAAGKQPVFRLTAVKGDKVSQDIYEYLKRVLPEVPVVVQSLYGEAGKDISSIRSVDSLAWPCAPSGMLVRPDGSVAPCCGPLANGAFSQPVCFANASEENGLLPAYIEWYRSNLLLLMQTAGLRPLAFWISEVASEQTLSQMLSHNPCDFCVRLWNEPALADMVRSRVEREDVAKRIDDFARVVFGPEFDILPLESDYERRA